MKWILPFYRGKILGIFRQAVEISRQHVVAQGQLVSDLLQGEGPFIPRFDQFAPVRNAPARFHVEDDARLPARRMSGPIEIEVAFIEERQVFPVVQGNRIILSSVSLTPFVPCWAKTLELEPVHRQNSWR